MINGKIDEALFDEFIKKVLGSQKCLGPWTFSNYEGKCLNGDLSVVKQA